MHIKEDQVEGLITHLQRWLDDGSFRAATLLSQQATAVVPSKEENREFVLREMTAEDGSSLGWYVDHSDFYCDIEKEDGVWGVYFRDKITDRDSYGEPGPPSNLITPIAVSERPWERRIGWCNEQNKCWAWSVDMKCWQLLDPRICADWVLLLPFHAIPLPQVGEVQP